MARDKISSLLVVPLLADASARDGHRNERDVWRAINEKGLVALSQPVARFASSPWRRYRPLRSSIAHSAA